MVFFTCNACGESLKKAQVEKHVNQCRGCQVLSCIDCGKDFWGDDYRNHVKCISEDQKYGGKGYAAKANKGEVKQQQWIERIHSAMNKPGISPRLKDILNQVSSYDNVPRKKQKFQNWMKNSLKIMDRKLHDQVWDIFSAAISSAPEAAKPCETTQAPVVAEATPAQTNGSSQQQNGTAAEEPAADKKKLNKRERKEARQMKSGKKNKNRAENGTAEEEQEGEQPCVKKSKRKRSCEEDEEELNGHNDNAEEETPAKKKKKSKKEVEQVDQTAEEEETEAAEEQTASKGKFNWKGTIKAVLRQAPDEGLSVKKVRKKVLAAYYTFSGEGNFKSEADLLALFNKKLNGNPKFKILKDKVRLVK